MSTFGLTQQHQSLLNSVFEKYLQQGQVIVYGSRARGNFTSRSDLDLAIQAAGTTDRYLLAQIKEDIDESDFPYLCDIQYFENIKNPDLRSHITRVGILFYKR